MWSSFVFLSLTKVFSICGVARVKRRISFLFLLGVICSFGFDLTVRGVLEARYWFTPSFFFSKRFHFGPRIFELRLPIMAIFVIVHQTSVFVPGVWVLRVGSLFLIFNVDVSRIASGGCCRTTSATGENFVLLVSSPSVASPEWCRPGFFS